MGFVLNLMKKKSVSLGAKILHNHLIARNDRDRAYVSLMTAFLKNGLTEVAEVMDNPSSFPKENCYSMFEDLLNARRGSEAKISQYKRLGQLPPPPILKHMRLCETSMNLMMSTVGIGFNPSTRKSVESSWLLVVKSSPLLADALAEIRAMYDLMESISGGADTPQIEDDIWIEMARKIPTFLRQ